MSDENRACLIPIRDYPMVTSKSVVRQWNKTYGSYMRRQTLTSLSDDVLFVMRIVNACFLSDTVRW